MGDHPRDAEPRAVAAAAHVLDVRDPLPDELRDPSFPAAVRGYDRHAVDYYVQQINRVIAELQVSGSPAAAVRQALDRVGEQTSGILRRARETAEEITRTAGEEAEEATARAKAEAADIVAAAHSEAEAILARASSEAERSLAVAAAEGEARTREADETIATRRAEAEAHMQALQAEIAAVADERRVLVDEVRRIAARLESAVAGAGEEEPAGEPVNGSRSPAA